MAIRTKTQLESDKNTLLASASNITASEHRSLVQNMIDSLESVIQSMTYAQMQAIAAPAIGDKVFVNDFVNTELFIYSGSYWKPVNGSIIIANLTTAKGTTAIITEEVLASQQLKADYLLNQGDHFKVLAYGTFGANTNTKTVSLEFDGGTLITQPGSTGVYNGGTWIIESTVSRLSELIQKSVSKLSINNDSSTPNSPSGRHTIADLTKDLGTDLNIELTAQNGTASADDIVFEGWIITLHKI